jgi:RNA polymerase sigma factor (sigma-70 family)
MLTASDRTTVEPKMREFEDIFREHSDLVFGTAFGITGRREDAEDIVQTVFTRLLRRGMSLEFYKSPRAYLYRAAVNQSLNILRSRRVHPTADLEDVDIPADRVCTRHDEVIYRKLYEAIGGLPSEAAEILILRYMQGYSDAAIAKLLGKSRINIAVRLHRARAQVKKRMRDSLGEGL